MFLNLDDKDILQINATIIAGDFIFLTLITSSLDLKADFFSILPIVISTMVIILFSLSSWFILRGQREPSIELMKVGFGIITAFGITILLLFAISGLRESISSLFYEITNSTITNKTIHNQTKIG